jgi:hypothetical protein
MGSIRAGFPWLDDSSGFLNGTEDRPTFGCQPQIFSAVADTLIAERFAAYNRGLHWLEHVRQRKPDIVVVSAGPHVMHDEDMERILSEVVEGHLREFPQLPLIWRTNFPGGCAEQPLPRPLEGEEEVLAHWRDYSSRRQIYNYDRFSAWDERAADLFAGSEARAARRFLLDLSPLRLRPDAHVGSLPGSPFPDDCLHLCLPGALHPLFAQLLQRLLINEIDAP